MSKIIKRRGSNEPGGTNQTASPSGSFSGNQLLQHAQREAELIVQKALQVREQSYQEGYQKGFEEAFEHHRQTLERLQEENAEKFQYFEQDLVRLALRIADKIIKIQLKLEPNTITRIVANALGAVRHQREIYIRVNPEDFETVKKNRNYLLDQLSRAREIDIRPDSEIPRGGCSIESEAGIIEASVDKQLSTLEEILLGNLKKWGFVQPEDLK